MRVVNIVETRDNEIVSLYSYPEPLIFDEILRFYEERVKALGFNNEDLVTDENNPKVISLYGSERSKIYLMWSIMLDWSPRK